MFVVNRWFKIQDNALDFQISLMLAYENKTATIIEEKQSAMS